MSSSSVSRVLVGVVAGLVVVGSMASTARADIVADWQFNGANFLADSSGHGHTLTALGSVSQVGDAASFSGGGGVLSANIDLTPYRQVTISWDENATNVTGDQIVYEETPNYNLYVGALLCGINSANMLCGHNNDYNYDTFTPATGPQSYSVTYNLDATTGADVVKVFQGTTEIGTASAYQSLPPAAFLNMSFNIGGRQGGGVAPYLGTIDNFEIVGTVPEPGTSVLLLTGLLGMLAYAWRKRK